MEVKDKAASLEVLKKVKETQDKKISELYSEIDNFPSSGGMSTSVKTALLNCFRHIAWTDSNGQSYVDALENALNTSGTDTPNNEISFVKNGTTLAISGIDSITSITQTSNTLALT